MFQTVQAYGFLWICALACQAIGAGILRPFFLFGSRPLQWASEGAVGLAVLSFVIFGMVSLGWASSAHLTILFFLLAGMVLWHWRGRWDPLIRSLSIPGSWAGRAIAVLLFFYVLWIVLMSALPVSDRDEMIYHLAIPGRLLAAGGWVRFQDNIYGYFPQLGEMLFLFGSGLSGAVAARTFHVFSGLLLALGLYGFSRQRLPRLNALFAVLTFLTVPVVMTILPLAYIDILFSLFVFLGYVALDRYFQESRTRWALLSGLFTGAAVATKYTGIQCFLIFSVLFLAEILRDRRKFSPAGLMAFGAACLVLAAPYLIRNGWTTGWPLFPFPTFSGTLSGGMNWDPERARLYLSWLGIFGVPFGSSSFGYSFAAPVLVFIQGRFNEPRFYEGIIGPVFLLVPFVLGLSKGSRGDGIKRLACFCVIFLYYWAFTTKQSRFLVPVLPFLGFLLAAGLARMEGGRKIFFNLLAVALIGLNLFLGIRETAMKQSWDYLRGRESADQYLRQRVSVYPLYTIANSMLTFRDRLYLINMKNYGYYLKVPFRADYIFERWNLDRLLEKNAGPGVILKFFNDRGITHLMMDEAMLGSEAWGLLPEAQADFRAFLSAHTVLMARDRDYILCRLIP